MFTPVKINHKIYCGADFDFDLTWSAGPTEAAATLVDLTGVTARMHVRPEVDSPILYLSLTTENGGITLGGTAGTVALHLSAAVTSEIDWTEAVYDLELVYPDGRVLRFLVGRIGASGEVTR